VSVAVCNPDRIGDVKIFGCEMSTKELCETFNMISGEKCQPKCLGTLMDLKNQVWGEEEGMRLLCGVLLPIFDGRGLIIDNNNDEFGEVKLRNVEEFLKDSQIKGFNYQFPLAEMAKSFEQLCGK